MPLSSQPSSNKQIRTLILVLCSGLVCALLLSGFLVYFYGPTGQYMAQNAMLAPDLITTLSYNDTNHKTGGMSRYVYDKINFSYYDEKTKQQHQMVITPEQYSQFYQLISHEKSYLNVPKEALDTFAKGIPATISIQVRTDSHAAWQDETKIFQKIEIAQNSNDFRIELHEQKSTSNLIYFSHPNIYQKAIQIFIKQ